MQGFTDIELLIPVVLDGSERRWLPIGMSVAAYENANGVTVERISRLVGWLPQTMQFDDGKDRLASKLAGSRRRVELRFVALGKRPGMGGGVGIRDLEETESGGGTVLRKAKADILFAPGDIIIVRHP